VIKKGITKETAVSYFEEGSVYQTYVLANIQQPCKFWIKRERARVTSMKFHHKTSRKQPAPISLY